MYLVASRIRANLRNMPFRYDYKLIIMVAWRIFNFFVDVVQHMRSCGTVQYTAMW